MAPGFGTRPRSRTVSAHRPPLGVPQEPTQCPRDMGVLIFFRAFGWGLLEEGPYAFHYNAVRPVFRLV